MFPIFLLAGPLVRVAAETATSDAVSTWLDGVMIDGGFKPDLSGQIKLLDASTQAGFAQVNEAISMGFSQVQAGLAHQTAMLTTLQTSIGAIGMVSVAGCALSAVSVYKLIQVQKTLGQIQGQIKDGFIDLKAHFDAKLQDMLEEQQRQRLFQAYNHYLKAIEHFGIALEMSDPINRRLSINNTVSIFTQSLAIYDNKEEYAAINLPAKLRRLECCWTIQAAIAEAHYYQEEYAASLSAYKNLHSRIIGETQSINAELTPANYRFALADLDWIYKNDMRLIKGKIAFLENHAKTQTRVPVAISPAPAETAETDFEKIWLPGAKLYLDCLFAPERLEDYKARLVRKLASSATFNPDQHPAVHVCNLYARVFNLSDSAEYHAPYLSQEQVSPQFLRHLEDYFLQQQNPRYEVSYKNVDVTNYHKQLGKASCYEEIHYFNYAVRQYIQAVTPVILKAHKVPKDQKTALHQRAQELGLSEKFAAVLDDLLIAEYKAQVKDAAAAYQGKVLALYLEHGKTTLSPEAAEDLRQYEDSLPLTVKEMAAYKQQAQTRLIAEKEKLVFKNKIEHIAPDNEVLAWELEDVFKLKKEQAERFLGNFKTDLQRYLDVYAVVSKGKTKLSDTDRQTLKEIQAECDLTNKAVAVLIPGESLLDWAKGLGGKAADYLPGEEALESVKLVGETASMGRQKLNKSVDGTILAKEITLDDFVPSEQTLEKMKSLGEAASKLLPGEEAVSRLKGLFSRKK
jgi:hypothetical protein